MDSNVMNEIPINGTEKKVLTGVGFSPVKPGRYLYPAKKRTNKEILHTKEFRNHLNRSPRIIEKGKKRNKKVDVVNPICNTVLKMNNKQIA